LQPSYSAIVEAKWLVRKFVDKFSRKLKAAMMKEKLKLLEKSKSDINKFDFMIIIDVMAP